jgi:hypothetical protein
MRMEVSGDVLIELMAVHFCCKGRKKTGQIFNCLPEEEAEFEYKHILERSLEPYSYAKELVSIAFSFLCVTIVR